MTKNLWWVMIETIGLVFLPLYIFMIRPDFLQWRVPFMAAMFLYVAYMTSSKRVSVHDFGLARGAREGWFIMTGVTLILAACLLLTVAVNPNALFIREFVTESIGFPILVSLFVYTFFSVPLQEFLLRGYYLARLQKNFEHYYVVLILVSLVFGLLHAPFANRWLSLGTFLISFFWTWFVMKYKTIYPVILSHILLGGIIMAASLFLDY
jgi:membrane protease YdiL (CAAX protease family)